MIWWMLLKTSSKTFPYIKWGRVVWTQIGKHFKTFNCDWEELKNCETYWKSFYYHQSNHTGKKKTTPPSGPTWRRRTRRSWLWGRRGWRSWCWRRTRSAAASAPAYLPGIAPAILMRFGFLMLVFPRLGVIVKQFNNVSICWCRLNIWKVLRRRFGFCRYWFWCYYAVMLMHSTFHYIVLIQSSS